MFDDSEKLIFSYSRGRGENGEDANVFADPLAIWNALVRACDGDVWGIIEATQPTKNLGPKGESLPELPAQALARADAEERLLVAVRVAFDLIPFDRTSGLGATSTHAWMALNTYLGFVRGEESGDGSLPDGSASTGGPPVVP